MAKPSSESSRYVMQPDLSERDIERLRKQYAYVDEVNATIRDEDIDLSDIPEWNEDQLANAQFGKFHRPRKDQITLRLDADTITWFRQRYPKYQTAMNAALRAYMESHDEDSETESDLRKTA
ncbi:MAG: BrnA antitoxin family protein [Thermomicrobiales bacterium]